MDLIERTVARANIARFLSAIELEQDRNKRAALTDLLKREEDRFGRLSERLDLVVQHRAQTEARIVEQRERILGLDAGSPYLPKAEALLENLLEIRTTLDLYIRNTQKSLDRAPL